MLPPGVAHRLIFFNDERIYILVTFQVKFRSNRVNFEAPMRAHTDIHTYELLAR
jgi:hypothetical protein